MRNLCALFMASAFVMSVGCSPTTPLHPGLDATRSIETANALADKFVPQSEDGEFDAPFNLRLDDKGKVSEIIMTTPPNHTYLLNDSIVKGDIRIFVPNWWKENSQSDVVVFHIQEGDNGISGQIHVISSEMMATIYNSDEETMLEALNYDDNYQVKAVFEVPASEVQASTTLQPQDITYAVNVDDEVQLRTTQAQKETDNDEGSELIAGQ